MADIMVIFAFFIKQQSSRRRRDYYCRLFSDIPYFFLESWEILFYLIVVAVVLLSFLWYFLRIWLFSIQCASDVGRKLTPKKIRESKDARIRLESVAKKIKLCIHLPLLYPHSHCELGLSSTFGDQHYKTKLRKDKMWFILKVSTIFCF